jgi:hypothetical protein
MTHEPGFIDTTLHRSLAPDARFQFINIAHWESVEAWQAAFAKHAPNAMLIQAGLDATPALYRVVVEYSHGPYTGWQVLFVKDLCCCRDVAPCMTTGRAVRSAGALHGGARSTRGRFERTRRRPHDDSHHRGHRDHREGNR